MSKYSVHTRHTAPAKSAELLAGAEQAFGFVPNLLGIMAESPAVLNTYLTVTGLFEQSSFTPTEQQIVLLTTSRFNECSYCVAAHTVIAGMQQVPSDVVDAIRNDLTIADSKQEALRIFTNSVVEKRGWVTAEDVSEFLAAGYDQAQLLEVLLGVTLKTLSNYVNHVAETPLDDQFMDQKWLPSTT